ncbi:MAG: hypothetical protein KDD70_08095, partial [Bdellovibrionales bacterium]|nr:hypothetical protein [Bdellovibrionales bacterium]
MGVVRISNLILFLILVGLAAVQVQPGSLEKLALAQDDFESAAAISKTQKKSTSITSSSSAASSLSAGPSSAGAGSSGASSGCGKVDIPDPKDPTKTIGAYIPFTCMLQDAIANPNWTLDDLIYAHYGLKKEKNAPAALSKIFIELATDNLSQYN